MNDMSEQSATPAGDVDLSPRPTPSDPGGRRRRRRLVPMLVLGLVLVAGGVIVTQFLSSAVDYFCNVDEVGVRDGCEEDRRIRLQGTVDADSVVLEPGRTTFSMSYGGVSMPVDYDGEPGGVFKECIPVVVHGVIEGGVLLGDRVEVKHSDEYEAENSDNISDAGTGAEGAGCP